MNVFKACSQVCSFLFAFFFSVPLFAQTDLTLSADSCRIWRDPQGIPHLKADLERVGVSCLGYIHAHDRGWQMDFFRKAVQGRRSEYFGRRFIKTDFFLRLLNLQEKAKALYQNLSPQDQAVFLAYSIGVNRGMKEYVNQKKSEFKTYDYTPEEWMPEDSLGLVLLQSFDQTKKELVLTQSEYGLYFEGANLETRFVDTAIAVKKKGIKSLPFLKTRSRVDGNGPSTRSTPIRSPAFSKL